MYDGFEVSGKLVDYLLSPGRKYRYLRLGDKGSGNKRSFKVRNDPNGNALKFESLVKDMQSLELEEHFDIIWKILSAILNLGEVRFVEDNNGEAEIENMDIANRGFITFFQVPVGKFLPSNFYLLNIKFIFCSC